MSFLNPMLAAVGLAAIAIPILIHLLMRRRRKPVLWGAMRFVLEAYKQHRRRLILERWLLLALRCLLIALVAMAIGRPAIGKLFGRATSGRTVYLLIDDSLTSGAKGVGGDASSPSETSLARHQKLASDILTALKGESSSGRAAVISLAGPARGLVSPPSSDLDAVAELVKQLRPLESRADLPGALALAAAAIDEERRRQGNADDRPTVVIISDLLRGSGDPGAASEGSTASSGAALPKLPHGTLLVSTTPAQRGAGNTAIIAVEPTRPVLITDRSSGGLSSEQAVITLRRFGPSVRTDEVSTVELRVPRAGDSPTAAGAREATRGTVRWAAGTETATVSLEIPGLPEGGAARDQPAELLEARLVKAGAAAGTSSATAGGAIEADDRMVRPVEVRDALRAGVLAPRRFGPRERVDRLEPAEWLRLALRPSEESGVEVLDLEPAALDSARLAGLDALWIARPDLLNDGAWQRIRTFVDGGGMVVIFPPADVNVHLWPDAMARWLGLDIRLGREAKQLGTPEAGVAVLGIDAAATTTATGATSGGILGPLAAELPELARAVTVTRLLPIESVPVEAAPKAPTGDQPGEPKPPPPPAPAATDSGAEGHVILRLVDGTPFVWMGAPRREGSSPGATEPKPGESATGAGLVAYVASALDLAWTNLPAKPLMVALTQELLRQGIGRAIGDRAVAAGLPAPIPPRSIELRRLAITAPTDRPEAADDALIALPDGAPAPIIRTAGAWAGMDDRGVIRGLMTVNADTRASSTESQTAEEVTPWIAAAAPDGQATWISGGNGGGGGGGGAGGSGTPGSPSAATWLFSAASSGSPVSLPLLIAAAAVALLELILARITSHADSGKRLGGILTRGLAGRAAA